MNLAFVILILQNQQVRDIPSRDFQLGSVFYAYYGLAIFIYTTILVLALILYFKIIKFLNLKIKLMKRELDKD
ncbi:hypothetical protein [Psychroserpens sp. SPM9]|uniref:hypothetical protein n=1 Tax=Psychroserpens sp. SPM9 TaxID=2975598 RepID=UPI0021A92EDB|nr:hypothetical protein [Psychroserpens sp. SPM9]MDG5490441.1 hypothetical protein [Psychroserpens sp. SPM9]